MSATWSCLTSSQLHMAGRSCIQGSSDGNLYFLCAFQPLEIERARAGESILPATTPPAAFLLNASALGPSERRGQSPENNHIFLYSRNTKALKIFC